MPNVFDQIWRKSNTTGRNCNSTAVVTLLFYFLTIFLGSGLMFIIEPFVAKMLLPIFGGSPNVWNTCVVFFQLILLGGYIFAHLIGTRLSLPRQLLAQAVVIWVPIIFLPVRLPLGILTDDHPVLSLLSLLTIVIGVVFFAISTTAPLLQKWYSQTNSIGSSDPYFLYAASNAGGLLGLLLYPFALEPNFKISEQSALLTSLYLCFAGLFTICGIFAFMYSRAQGSVSAMPAGIASEPEGQISAFTQTEHENAQVQSAISQSEHQEKTGSSSAEVPKPFSYPNSTQSNPDRLLGSLDSAHLRWIIFTMLPSSLVLGLTAYITSELSTVPFFWVAPLFIYLVSFVVAFARLPSIVFTIVRSIAPVVALFVVMIVSSHTFAEAAFGDPLITTALSLQLVCLFLVCLACHSVVASERPSTDRLTEFYVVISVGGILGSSFNTFVAPLLFRDLTEYPLVLLVAAILLLRLPRFRETLESRTALAPLFLVPLAVLLISALSSSFYNSMLAQKDQASVLGGAYLSKEAMLELLFQVVIPLVSCLLLARSTKQLRAGLAILALFSLWTYNQNQAVVYQGRNFFGPLSVVLNRTNNTCEFWHGHTIHGTESLDPAKRGMPTSYFYPTGPIGSVMRKMFGEPETWKTEKLSSEKSADAKPLEPIAVLGLGCGTTAAYAKTKQRLDYFEINQDVIDVANNPFYFTYLFQAKKRNVDLRIVHGDARLEIQKAPYNYYKLILVDAFSSDAIPMHLITKEAVEIYLRTLKHDGVLAFNISNQYYDMKPVLARLSEELKLTALVLSDLEDSLDGERFSTEWVFFTKNEDMVATLKEVGGKDLKTSKITRLWTDDHCSPLSVLSVPLH